MPKRTDLHKILVIGSGPIVIGQACEFDYSGTQACRALKSCGYEVVLVNSNPATIMTDPDTADRTYVEPITVEAVSQIIEQERPDALLPNMGGQTGLNCAVGLGQAGVLERYGVEVIGCNLESIEIGEDRLLFADAMRDIGLEVPRSGLAYSVEEAKAIVADLGFPVVIRPSFTLGGAGGGVAYDMASLIEIVSQGLELSIANEVLVEESVEGWKEIEMEVMRDAAGNGIVICSIENLDPMGVHTGDSITVAPAQTLTDPELQNLRDYSLAILERVGVATGGSNVQFAISPYDGRIVVIEMNPRVSRSSALASKATGFPIAKAAALLAVGYTLDEITNDITRATPACFEPSIDYCVVKVPRFAFEKFKGASAELTTRMKSVGEVMAIGRTFEEALEKAMRSLELGHDSLGSTDEAGNFDEARFRELVSKPTPDRINYVAEALRRGWSVEDVHNLTGIDEWFLSRIADLMKGEEAVARLGLDGLDAERMRQAKSFGYSDHQIARLVGSDEDTVRARRKELGVVPVVKTVDTCAGEFPARTSYHYKTYDQGDHTEFVEADRPRVIILSAGPNRIGQGIEFDYCCVHAAYALHAQGYETVMVNCNPETVSTDYDTSDRLYFEPLTYEDVMDIVELEKPVGVMMTLGGQTPIKLAGRLAASGVPIMGTQPDAIDLAEDRDRFSKLLDRLEISYPASSTAETYDEALEVAAQIGYPLLVRPSYVLGGRGMAIVYDPESLRTYIEGAAHITPDHPVYLDAFLEGAVELDVDALCDGEQCYIGAVLEHIEECGIHSGDSACCTPPFSLSQAIEDRVCDITRTLALECGAHGLLNVQYAVKDGQVSVIEMNPRASRTVPFSSKATGVPLAKYAALIMAGSKIADLGLPPERRDLGYYACKEAVMPFGRFPGADIILGPEMRSTGEVMGIDRNFPAAYAKTQLAIDYSLPTGGKAFISVNDRDKRSILPIARDLVNLGFELVSTSGTAKALRAAGLKVEVVRRMNEMHPNIGDEIASGEITLMINTPFGGETRSDGFMLRTTAVRYGLCYVTTIEAATAFVQAIQMVKAGPLNVYALQDLPKLEEEA